MTLHGFATSDGTARYSERFKGVAAEGHFRFEQNLWLSSVGGGSHCMTPRYLAHQLAQSLVNMNLETVDVYYVHNPESQLQSVSRDEFDKRLRAAFEQLESERAAGRVKFYGVATWNGFRVAA